MKPVPFILLYLACSSCAYTYNVLDAAKGDRRPQKVNAVRNAYIDTSGALIVNFTATLSPRQRHVPLHVMVPVDTLASVYRKANKVWYYSMDMEKEQYRLSGIRYDSAYKHDVTDTSLRRGLLFDLDRTVLKSGYYPVAGLDTIRGSLLLPASSRRYKYDKKGTTLNARHIVLLYVPERSVQQKCGGSAYVVINVEPSARKKYIRYGLTPFAVLADVLTAPIQFIEALIVLSKIPIS